MRSEEPWIDPSGRTSRGTVRRICEHARVAGVGARAPIVALHQNPRCYPRARCGADPTT